MARWFSSLWNGMRGRRPAAQQPAPAPAAAVDDTVLLPGPPTGPPPEPFPVMPGPPEGYLLLESIGRGWVGEVFRALSPDGLGVALKRIPRSHVDEANLSRLVESLRSIRHPFLLATHACHEEPETLWLVTELADEDVDTWLRRCQAQGHRGIPAPDLLDYLSEAALALDFLRANRLRHRGLKPSNLLRVDGHARVADFVPWPPPMYMHLPVGLPPHLSPEEWRGEVTDTSDQYKLAMIYCQMRTGQLPFPAETPYQRLMQQLEGAPDLGPLPQAERSVVGRALARESRQRYGSCVEMMEALRPAVQCLGPDRRTRRLEPAWLRWNDGCVAKMAKAIESEGRFEELAILADALEEAGCADEDVLRHCRQPARHVRGCWVLRLCLGKDAS
jgi:serine/threonine protein kinase